MKVALEVLPVNSIFRRIVNQNLAFLLLWLFCICCCCRCRLVVAPVVLLLLILMCRFVSMAVRNLCAKPSSVLRARSIALSRNSVSTSSFTVLVPKIACLATRMAGHLNKQCSMSSDPAPHLEQLGSSLLRKCLVAANFRSHLLRIHSNSTSFR